MKGKRLLAAVAAVVLLASGAYGAYWYRAHPTPPEFPLRDKPILIAHAGGMIDGHVYTNSLEAVESALQQGFLFIELDLVLTSDGNIIAAHDWEMFAEQSGALWESAAPRYEEVRGAKLFGTYSILSAGDISRIFGENAMPWLVTDKIRDLDALLGQVHIPKEHLLVEVFSYKSHVPPAKPGA